MKKAQKKAQTKRWTTENFSGQTDPIKQCHRCDFVANNSKDIEIHFKTCHVEYNVYKCNFCELEFSKSSDLQTHIAAIHSCLNPCSFCGQIFNDVIELNNRMAKKHFAANNENDTKNIFAQFKSFLDPIFNGISANQDIMSNAIALIKSYMKSKKTGKPKVPEPKTNTIENKNAPNDSTTAENTRPRKRVTVVLSPSKEEQRRKSQNAENSSSKTTRVSQGEKSREGEPRKKKNVEQKG